MNQSVLFKDKKAFVGYLTAGLNGMQYTVDAACALVEGGVDILELGMPFSDPVADGPVIQEAMCQARAHLSSMEALFSLIERIKVRCPHTVIVLFTYYNPLLQYGLSKALLAASDRGVDYALVVDLPLEESGAYFEASYQANIQPVHLIAPSTPHQRIEQMALHPPGFFYYVCRQGVTGVQPTLPSDFNGQIQRIKNAVKQPVVCGFGIGHRQQAAQIIQHADGFVVGSSFVRLMLDKASPDALSQHAQRIDPRF